MKGRLKNQRSEQIKLTNGTMTNKGEMPVQKACNKHAYM